MGRGGKAASGDAARQLAKDFNKAFLLELKEGLQVAEGWKKAFEGVGKKTVSALLMEIRPGLHQMSGESQMAAAQAMVGYARELERKGELPKGV